MLQRLRGRRHQIVLLSSGAYFLGVSTIMLWHNVWLSPDQFFIFALVVALFFGKGKKFIRDWTPFILVLLGYEFLRGAVPAIIKFPVHSQDLITIERDIFRIIPTLYLQEHWSRANQLMWYDFLFSLAYMSYFIVPLLFAFYAWLNFPKLFKVFAGGFILVHFLAFVTWVFFPAMPPWMAAEKNLLPMVTRILYLTTAKMTVPGGFPTVYNVFAPNPVAAVPSMHAALPTLMLLTALYFRKNILSILCLGYAAVVYVGIVYLGEHYVIDAIIGAIYALVTFLAVKIILQKLEVTTVPQANSL